MKTLVLLFALIATHGASPLDDDPEPADEARSLTGECRTVMPDGRIQSASFTCAPDGFKSVIKYSRKRTAQQSNRTTSTKQDHRLSKKTDNQRNNTTPSPTKKSPLPLRARKALK